MFSSVVFCRGHGSRGHGSPVPCISRRRARTGEIGCIDSGHHAANVGDPEVWLLEVRCADALVLRQKRLEDDVLELMVLRSLQRVVRIKTFAASIELIQ